ncbi:hypothetical protein OG589_13005 [Sphaerisporangium sp. NBC_01403]|uniref:hypothetical protein n=1 Tax=Sphaerisporangium sp. NBC_01403 TaxID=2903599 RepID=UPI00324E4CF0
MPAFSLVAAKGGVRRVSVSGRGDRGRGPPYFLVVGLDKADKLGSAIGAVLGLAGLCLSVYGMITGRPKQPPAGPGGGSAAPVAPSQSPQPLASASPSPGAGLARVRNDISGGDFHAR